MSEHRHSIQRQVIELTVHDPAQAERLHHEVSRIYRQRIVPLIDHYCSELSAPDQLDRIDRLELDLGRIDERNLETQLVERMQATLRPALAAQISAQNRAGGAARVTAWLELMALFARTGSLPWWADASAPQLLDGGVRYLLEHTPERLHQLIRQMIHQPDQLQRFVDHVSDEVLTRLISSLAPALHTAPAAQVVALLRDTSALHSWGLARRRRSVWRMIVQVAATSTAQQTAAASLYQAVLRHLAAEHGTPYEELLAELIAALEQASPAANLLLAALRQENGIRSAPEAARAAQDDDPLVIEQRDVDVLYIANAGLVILWPFLPAFFGELGLLAGDRFTGPAAQHRAAGLLQHLATGEPTFAEYLLPLNKLLCGMDVDAVFDFGEALTDAEVASCDTLLTAVIAQAPILRSMSPAGFRGTFLLRQAALSTRHGAWLLRVERQTYDLVLDRFPWSWEWLRLPWMDAALRVEW